MQSTASVPNPRSTTPSSAAYPYPSSSMRRVAEDRPIEGSSSGSQSRREGRTRSSSAGNGVETTVTRLLVAIKQLLESLTNWSQLKTTEYQVSDVYVKLGNDFNAAVAAFASTGIDMTELLSVPQDLRDVLELCLAEDATPATLERYLPNVRSIITSLLTGLRQKQSDYRRLQTVRPARSSGTTSRSSRQSHMEAAAPQEDRTIVPSSSGFRSRDHRSVPVPSSVRTTSGSRRPNAVSLDETARAQSAASSTSNERFVGGFVPQRRRDERNSEISSPQESESSRPQSRSSGRTSTRPVLPATPVDSPQEAPSKNAPPARGSSLTGLGITMIPEEPPVSPTPELPQSPLPTVPANVKRYSLIDKPISSPLPEETQPPSPPSPPIQAKSPPPQLLSVAQQTAPQLANVEAPPIYSSSALPIPPPPPDVVVQEASPQVDESDSRFEDDDVREDQPRTPAETSQPAVVSPLDPNAVDSERVTTLGAQSTLAALQRSDMLERRASKRFSTFNFMRMGASGPSAREKQSANLSHNRRSMMVPGDLASVSEGEEPSRQVLQEGLLAHSSDAAAIRQSPNPSRTEEVPPLPPLPSFLTMQKTTANGVVKAPSPTSDREDTNAIVHAGEPTTAVVGGVTTSLSRTSLSSDNLTVFLTLGMQTKKAEIESSISFAGLRVLFMDRFTYNPGLDNFPAIYIEDPTSKVKYELENLDEIQNGSRLLLNVEPLDQVKQHIDLQISSVSQDIRELKMAMAASRRMSLGPVQVAQAPSPPASAPRPSDVQFQAAASKLSRMKTDIGASARAIPEPVQPQLTGSSEMVSTRIVHDLHTQFDEVQNIRRDLGVMRQLYVDFINQTKESLSSLRTQTNNVRELANTKVGGTRAYIDAGKDKLDARSQIALTRIEELTDSVESMKSDVVRRQVIPKPAVMRSLKSDIEACATELESLTEHMGTIKPMWKKTWQEELENIVEEQKFLTHQEELLADLVEDHKALKDVFGHVEKFTALKGSGTGTGSQRGLRSFKPPPPEEGHTGLSTVMMEIRGAAVDPERRLKAIAAAQKTRERELASRSDEFQAELSNFVDGKKLKLTGGAEEIERVRQKRNEQTLKAMFSSNSSNTGGDLSSLSPPSPTSPDELN